MLHVILILISCCLLVAVSGIRPESMNEMHRKSPYEVKYWSRNDSLYSWEDVHVSIVNLAVHHEMMANQTRQLKIVGVPVSTLTEYKVYISMTTVSFRIKHIKNTIYSILNGAVLPTQILLFISREGLLLDEGITTIPNYLLTLAAMNLIRIVYTDNIGPHRKLLPLLAKHYNKPDVLILTADDDVTYGKEKNMFLGCLLHQFQKHNQSTIVAAKVRRIGLCNGHDPHYTQYSTWQNYRDFSQTEMLLLPIGMGGVLYRPQFFHPIVFSERFRNISSTADDLAFRLSTMANGVKVTMAANKCGRKHAKHNNFMKVQNITVMMKSNNENFPFVEKKSKMPLIEVPHMDSHGILHRNRMMKSLFAINVAQKNDETIFRALEYLKEQEVIPDFGRIISTYSSERGESCVKQLHDNKNETLKCSVYDCSLGILKPGSLHVSINMTQDEVIQEYLEETEQ